MRIIICFLFLLIGPLSAFCQENVLQKMIDETLENAYMKYQYVEAAYRSRYSTSQSQKVMLSTTSRLRTSLENDDDFSISEVFVFNRHSTSGVKKWMNTNEGIGVFMWPIVEILGCEIRITVIINSSSIDEYRPAKYLDIFRLRFLLRKEFSSINVNHDPNKIYQNIYVFSENLNQWVCEHRMVELKRPRYGYRSYIIKGMNKNLD